MALLSRISLTIAAALIAGAAGAGVTASAPAASAQGDLCAPRLAQVLGASDASGRASYVACLPVAERPMAGARIDLRYSEAVSRATGTDAIVACWDNRAWARIGRISKLTFGHSTAHTGGFVWDGQQLANLPGRVCRFLDAVAYRHARRVDRSIAWAFKNLTHEAIHVAGVDDEAATECYAIQLMAQTIDELGLGRTYGERVAQLSWSRYPRMKIIGPRYWTRTCHDGGPLDVRPTSRDWPS
jgi:hypothetical protein